HQFVLLVVDVVMRVLLPRLIVAFPNILLRGKNRQLTGGLGGCGSIRIWADGGERNGRNGGATRLKAHESTGEQDAGRFEQLHFDYGLRDRCRRGLKRFLEM